MRIPSAITRYRISPEPMSEGRVQPGKGPIAGLQLCDEPKPSAWPQHHAATTSALQGTRSFRLHNSIQRPLSNPGAVPTR
jgi:hypothetical protein